MVVNHRPSKRLKRRVSADLHNFSTFLSADTSFDGAEPFRAAVKRFVSKYARPPTYSTPLFAALATWQVAFRVGDEEEVVMEVVEEDVTGSASVYCNQCRVVGWSGHPVCNKRYHFMIKAASVTKEYEQQCGSCGKVLFWRDDESCQTCGAMVTEEEFDKRANGELDDSKFLLHGLVHSNGYGHLLTLNGREGGSKFISGCDMMNFWDRLCKALSVKKVSVMDLSKKYEMEYRLLHTISQGRTWYGNWGYEFGVGCYGITKEAYCRAVETLSTMPLSVFFFRRRETRSQLQVLIQFYQSMSDSKLVTFRDLFSFLFRLLHEATSSNNLKYITNSVCCWTDEDVERVQRSMLKVLMAAHPSSSWVSHKALKGAMSMTASLDLIHYCLKHLGGTVSQNGMAVRARCNPNSATVEYRLEGPGSWYDYSIPCRPSKEKLIRDLRFLYDLILNPKTEELCRSQAIAHSISDSVTKLLDCKQFVKNYEPEKVSPRRSPTSIFVWCQVEVLGEPRDNPTPPQELVVLPSNATVADLKREVAEAFREIYAMFRTFSVTDLPDIGRVHDSVTLQLLIGLYGAIRVRGRCDRKYGHTCFRTEKGTESWIVDCACGATDDDGEPMLACDACSVWQHTRCVGLATSEDIPEKFTCSLCVNSNHYKGTETAEEKPSWISQSQIICGAQVTLLSCCMASDNGEKIEASEWNRQSNTCRNEVTSIRDPLASAYDVR